MGKIAFIFPGQGSQYSGMGRELYENYSSIQELFDKIDATAGRSISKLCFEGSEEELKQTINSQPAILSTSIASYEALKQEIDIKPDFVAGHSLGEYSALYAAGVMQAEELIKLVQKRAELMANAPSGSMTAILGLDEEKINTLIQESSPAGIICAANYNTPDQTVISGETAAIEQANELAKEMGAKRVVPLAVSGAFHSPLMRPISEVYAKFVDNADIKQADTPVVTNVDAQETTSEDKMASKMVKQMYSSVYWKQSISYMMEQGVDTFIEIGPGKVLSGMIRKISRDVKVYNVSDKISLEKVKEAFASQVSV